MKEIYFHVGLGKTGTKYLQFDVFPKFKGIYYIHTTKYRKSKKIIKKKKEKKFLVSREFDRQLEREVRWFAKDFPDTRTIIVLRRHDEWILSQYKRFVKNGYTIPFDEFFNFKNTGIFKIEHLYFYRNLEILEEVFKSKPLVLFYDELRENPFKFLDKIAKFTGASYDKNKIPLKRTHASYSEKQLKVIYKVAKLIDIKPHASILKRYLLIYPIRYPILYITKYLPNSLIPRLNIFPSEKRLKEIREFYKEDWEKCRKYAEEVEKEFLT